MYIPIHKLLAYRHLLLGHVSNAASAARNRDPLPVVPATSIEHVSPRVPVGFFERVWRASNALSNPSISPVNYTYCYLGRNRRVFLDN